jgi:hypothetical protein
MLAKPDKPLLYLIGHDGRGHFSDAEPIRAATAEDALKIVMGGFLWLSPEEARQVETMELVRRFDEQAERDEEPGSEAIVVEEIPGWRRRLP